MIVSAEEMRAAQVFTMSAIAVFLLAPYVPGQGRQIRLALLAVYGLGAVGFVLYVLLR
jgi:hypothetical protein